MWERPGGEEDSQPGLVTTPATLGCAAESQTGFFIPPTNGLWTTDLKAASMHGMVIYGVLFCSVLLDTVSYYTAWPGLKLVLDQANLKLT